MNIKKYSGILWVTSLLCAFWMYGFFCYIWNGTLHELKFLNPIVQYGFIAPMIGFPLSICCIIYGKIINQVLSIPLLCFHGFWVLFFILALMNNIVILLSS
jgi:hypothetical protein